MTSLASNVSPFAHHRGRHYAGACKALSRMTGQVVIAEAEPRTRHFVMTYVLRYNITYVGSTPTMEPALRDRPPTVRWTVKEPRPSRRKSNGRSHVLLSAMAAVLVAGLMILPACAQDGAVHLKVVATFSILGDFAKKIGGDRADVATLVGPNGDVHVYTPTAADAQSVRSARLLIVNGLGLEGWLPRLIESFPAARRAS